MSGKWPVLLVLCVFSLSACAGIPGVFGPQERETAAVGSLPDGKPLKGIERQQVDCQARLGKIEGIRIDHGQGCVIVTFRYDTLFEHNGERIAPTACGLDDLADILKSDCETKVKIDAHTDSMKSEEENLALSESRAGAIKEALVARGVDASRITARGWGESKPAASNATEAGRRANRRVSVTLFPSPS